MSPIKSDKAACFIACNDLFMSRVNLGTKLPQHQIHIKQQLLQEVLSVKNCFYVQERILKMIVPLK